MSQYELKAEWEVLERIQNVALSMSQQLIKSYNIAPVPQTCAGLKIPKLAISFPNDILAPFSKLPVSEDIRQALLSRFKLLCDNLLQQYTSSYLVACQSRARASNFDNLTAINQAYKARFQSRCLSMVRNQVSSILSDFSKYQRSATERRQMFKTEYTPALEKYFEYNTYPSAADRLILATKSKMAPRQIEVWFQNHRNRAKKEGKILKRVSSALPLERALRVLDECISDPSADPDHEDESSESDDLEDTDRDNTTSCIDFWDRLRPSHAFPAIYPPRTPDAFPSENGGVKFSPIRWTRTASKGCVKLPHIDMEEFVHMFALKLHLCDGSSKKQSNDARNLRKPWYFASVTVPFSAPLPSLVRAAPTHPLPLISPVPVRSTSPSCHRETAKISPSTNQVQSKVRKTSPLLRRFPAVPSSSFQHSRSSSFTSDLSSPSRKSSTSSHSSSGPTTPPLSPVSRAQILPTAKDDLHKLLGLDTDSVALLSSISSQNFNLTCPLDKYVTLPVYDTISRFPLHATNYIQAHS